ncbi:MAG TPA: hypothetical protein P5267_02785, partial [Patescibacteria group bacterium]|nr:hypothetical protein [Patescibacteria group bacterium]
MSKKKIIILIIILFLVVYLAAPFFVDLRMEKEPKSLGFDYNTNTDKYSDEYSIIEKGICL